MSFSLRDLNHLFRVFAKSPGFTFSAIAALALGIGSTTAIFSVVDAVLLKPLQVSDPERLVMLMTTGVSDSGERVWDSDASPVKFGLWRTQTSVIQDVSAFIPGVMNYTGTNILEQIRSMRVSSDFFRCLGINITRGRAFVAGEDIPNGPRVVIIGEGLWRGKFGAETGILGKTIVLSGEPYDVIGVAAGNPGLREFGSVPDVYVPFQIDANSRDEGNYFKVVARLTPGVTIEQAKDRLQALANENRSKYPNSIGNDGGFTVTPLRNALIGDVRPLLRILVCAVGLVLLIACANVANLLLVQATKRRGEIAIRVALGASRGRLIRQFLAESVLLSVLGGGLGSMLGYVGIRALLAGSTADLPLVGQNGSAVTIDWRLLGFALAMSIVTGIAFGIFPALQASRLDVNSTLKGTARSGTGFRQNKTRSIFVISQSCLAVILLIGAALLIRSFVAIYSVDRGFATNGVITMRTLLTGPKYAKTGTVASTIRLGLDQIRSLPGVEAAGAGCSLPLHDFYGLPFKILGPLHSENGAPDGVWSAVSPGFLEVFSIPVKRGRTFTNQDEANSPPVVVISERLAKTYWGDRDPLLDRIVIGDGSMEEFKNEPPRQVIGIVGDVRNAGLHTDPTVDRVMYVPQSQLPNSENEWLVRNGTMAWAVRTRAEPLGMVAAIRERLERSTGLPVSNILSMNEVMSLSMARQRFNMLLMTVFGCTALLLAAIGIYGLMAFTVEQRMREIGIRLALGADHTQVRNMVIFQGMRLAAIGVAIGIGIAWGLSHFIESLLFGVKARDITVFLTVPLLLGLVALVSVWLPASRARAANPIDCLRSE